MAIIQVNFDPTLWSAGSGTGTAFGDNGYDCAQVWLDRDGTTCWAFEYFGSGFKRFNLSDGSTVHEDAMFGTPGFQSAHYWYSRESTGMYWQQDDAGNYYTMFDGNSGYFPLQKFQIGSGTVGNLLNGYCTDPTTFDINGGLTPTLPTFDQIEDFRVFKSGGVHYIAMIGNRVSISGNNHGVFYIINADTLTFVGSWVAPTNNEDGWQVFQDSAGDIWCATQGPAPAPEYVNLVKWHPADGATGTTLNFTTPGTGVHTVLGSTLGSAFASSGFVFATYVPANNSVFMGQSINATGPACSIDLTTFAVSNVVPDNGTFFENGVLDDAQAAMDNGVISGVLAIPGDILSGGVPSPTQEGGIINLIDPTTLALLSTTNVTTAINAQGGLTPVPAQHINFRGTSCFPPFSTLQWNGTVAVVAYQFIGSPVYIVPLAAPVSTPILDVSPLTLSFTAPQGGPNPSSQNISIANDNGGTLNWTTASDQSWLSAGTPSGTGDATVAISVDVTGLLAGTIHTGHITVTAAGATGSPKVVTVTLTIPALPTLFCQAVPSTITQGDSSTLSWATTNATSLTIDNGIGSVALNGSMPVSPTASTFYHFTATGPGGTVTGYVEVEVISNQATFALQKIILTLKQDRIPVRGRNGGGRK